MNIHKLDLNLLVVFDCIYTHGSVTRAAEVLHLTQPSVSHALNRLRDRLNDPLFVRDGQKLRPTATAQRLIVTVQQALKLLEGAISNIHAFDPQTADTSFQIGMRPLLESAYFPKITQTLTQLAPNIALSSVQLTGDNFESDLSNGKMSVAIDVFRTTSEHIQRQKLSTAPIVVLARKDHPQIKNNQLSLEDYLALDHLLVSSRAEGHGVEDRMLAKQGKHRTIRIRCQHIKTGLQLTAASDVLMTVSRNLLGDELNLDQLQILEAPFPSPEIDIYLYWHSSNDADQGLHWLKENIAAVAMSAPEEPIS